MNKKQEEWIKKMEERGYLFYQNYKCDCGGTQYGMVCSVSVIHARCPDCEHISSGFGGPKTMSWEEAVINSEGEKGREFVEREKAAGRY